MYELIPIVTGVVAGLAAMGLDGRPARIAALVAVALAAGVTASTPSGEIAESWAFVLWDTAQALAAGALTVVAATRVLTRRRAGGRGG